MAYKISKIRDYEHGDDDEGHYEKVTKECFVVLEEGTEEAANQEEHIVGGADCDSHTEIEDLIKGLSKDDVIKLSKVLLAKAITLGTHNEGG